VLEIRLWPMSRVWKCAGNGCGYHNFDKNVSCLSCGALLNEGAVVAEGGRMQFPSGNSYGGPPGSPSMTIGSTDASSYGGMTPGSSTRTALDALVIAIVVSP